MKYRRFVRLICLALVMSPVLFGASDRVVSPIRLETFIVEPARINTISIWVPADRVGPLINRSCRAERDCLYSCTIPSVVSHSKTESCRPRVARLLAEQAAPRHESYLPLTIFNGWQWEYSFSLCQYESASYDLPARGGSWEASWEAILTYSVGENGSVELQTVCPVGPDGSDVEASGADSRIEIGTFDQMRLRTGSPKIRKL